MKVSNTKTMTKAASRALRPPAHALAGGLLMAMAACLTMTRSVAAGPFGACCMPCECLQADEESCFELGGSWLGPETDCLKCPSVPLFGACCLPDGCSELSVLCCFDSGGVFQGDGVPCKPDSCLGACCQGGACEDGVNELLCADLGGKHVV